jgi:hypothetical protein
LSKDPRQTFGTGAETGPDVVQLLEVRGKMYEFLKEPEKPDSYYRTLFLFCQVILRILVLHIIMV